MIKARTVIVWQTSDGKLFEREDQAHRQQEKLLESALKALLPDNLDYYERTKLALALYNDPKLRDKLQVIIDLLAWEEKSVKPEPDPVSCDNCGHYASYL